MADFFAPGGAGDALPRLSFLEPILGGRRVLEIGSAGPTGGASAAFLAERGAAAVLSLDEAGAVERAAARVEHPFVQFRTASPEELPRGAFDLVVVHDGAALSREPGRLAGLKPLLSSQGVLVTAIPAAGGPTLASLAGEPPADPDRAPAYEPFAAALAEVFPVVEVATQSASVAYVIAAFAGDAEPDVTVDGSLAGTSGAAHYVFLCGSEPTGLAGLTVVALPPAELVEASRALAEAARAHEACPDPERVAAEREGLRREIADREARLRALEGDVAEVLSRLRERDADLAELGARLRESEARADEDRADASRRDAAARLAIESQRVELEQAVAALTAEREVARQLPPALEALEALRTELRAREAGAFEAAESARAVLAARGADAQRAAEEASRERGLRLEAEASAQATRAEAQAARAGLASALSRAESAEARAAELEKDLDEVSRKAAERGADLEVELSRARADLADREREFEVARRHEATAASLMAQRDALRDELHAAKTRHEQSAEEAVALAARLAEVERAAAAEGAEKATLRSRLEELVPRFEAEAARARESSARLETAGRLAAELEGRVASLEEELRAGSRKAEESDAAREAAEASLARAYEELARAGEGRDRAGGRAAEAERRLAADRLARAESERASAEAAGRHRAAAEQAEAQAASLEAELQAVRWEKDEADQRLAALQQSGTAELARMREEVASRGAELVEVRRAAAQRAEQVSAMGARVEELEARLREVEGAGPGGEPALAALASQVKDLELRLAEAEEGRREAQSALAARSAVPGDPPATIERLTRERDAYVQQLADRDARITRLQRELADKTERLGRLAKDLAEMKSRGLGKIFQR